MLRGARKVDMHENVLRQQLESLFLIPSVSTPIPITKKPALIPAPIPKKPIPTTF